MADDVEITNNEPAPHTQPEGNTILCVCLGAYLLYALFLLIECLDFTALLHSPEPGFSATYNLTNVMFFVLDLIICVTLGLVLMIILLAQHKKPTTVVITLVIITLLRAGLMYYLYEFDEGEYQIAPYIHKKANEMSGFVRAVMLPLQLLAGAIGVWQWIKIGKKQRSAQSAIVQADQTR